MEPRILFIGDKNVGKSSIKKKLMEIKASTQISKINLQLVDVDTDIEQMVLFSTSIFSDVKVFILVFDVTNVQTLNYIRRVQSKLMILLSNNKIPGILLGNKIDERNEFKTGVLHVSKQKGIEVANELSKVGGVYFRIPYFECSIYQQNTIEKLFDFITTKLQGLFTDTEDEI